MDGCADFFQLPCCEGCWLNYRTFYICGDPALLQDVRRALAVRGFEPLNP
jgi:hypothetical protein